MKYKIDFSEPIPKMVKRLKNEHHGFRLELIQIEETSKTNPQKQQTRPVWSRTRISHHRGLDRGFYMASFARSIIFD